MGRYSPSRCRQDSIVFAARVALLRPEKAQETIVALNHAAFKARVAAVEMERAENWNMYSLFQFSAERSEHRSAFLKWFVRNM